MKEEEESMRLFGFFGELKHHFIYRNEERTRENTDVLFVVLNKVLW